MTLSQLNKIKYQFYGVIIAYYVTPNHQYQSWFFLKQDWNYESSLDFQQKEDSDWRKSYIVSILRLCNEESEEEASSYVALWNF